MFVVLFLTTDSVGWGSAWSPPQSVWTLLSSITSTTCSRCGGHEGPRSAFKEHGERTVLLHPRAPLCLKTPATAHHQSPIARNERYTHRKRPHWHSRTDLETPSDCWFSSIRRSLSSPRLYISCRTIGYQVSYYSVSFKFTTSFRTLIAIEIIGPVTDVTTRGQATNPNAIMSPPPPPPPPPPPICLPFRSKKPKRVTTLAQSEKGSYSHHSYGSFPDSRNGLNYDLRQQDSYSPTSTFNSKTSLAKSGVISEDSESYNVPLPVKKPSPATPRRFDSKKWGYEWGAGKEKDAEKYSAASMVRKDSAGSSFSTDSLGGRTSPPGSPDRANVYRRVSSGSGGSRSTARPGIYGNDSSSTLVGSALERKINDVESVREKVDSGPRLDDLRKQMAKDNLDY